MKIFKYRTACDNLPPFQQDHITEDMLFFDIETTGLSAARDTIYCIGCGYRMQDEMITELYFAETQNEEAEIIRAFSERLAAFDTIVTFNGTTFDLPFVVKKINLSGNDHSENDRDDSNLFTGKTHIDLYKETRRLNKLLQLPHCKQKDVEQFMRVTREDQYNGGQLIEFYKEYTVHPDTNIRDILLLHNREDIEGMYQIFGIMAYSKLLEGVFRIELITNESGDRSEQLIVQMKALIAVPQNITYLSNHFYLSAKQKELYLRIPVYQGELKTFFSDPENYYYLPEEDSAIHKSVGGYVDSDHRKKATRKTCYTKSLCKYITSPAKGKKSKLRLDYEDKNQYLDLGHMNEESLREFIIEMFHSL